MVAVASGAISWLCYDGFIIGRHADLAWHGAVTGWQAAVCVGAGAAGGLGAAAWTGLRQQAVERQRTGPHQAGAHWWAGERADWRQGAGEEKAAPTGSQSRRYGENVVYLAAVRYQREVRKTSA
jgi:hypothetical protein